jgi:prevent-host-death family protein
MDEAISAVRAKRHFSKLLQAVRGGRSYVVTSHGKAVARIVPIGAPDGVMAGARAALIARLRSQPVLDVGPWAREELYDR